MSLYNKYRPTTFEEIKGNEVNIESLSKMLSNLDTAPHSYLFTGPTGCGKTTIGRIIASSLGAVKDDFIEVDSADFRGIDMVREIRMKSMYRPLHGKCRVWLLDECHKMTNDAQNALLKILEHPPKHVYFILCTTDPQKLLSTVKGRCSHFTLQLLNEIQMRGLLMTVVKGENETLTKPVYQQIIDDSQGHPRNALQILEQVLNAEPDNRLVVAEKTAELVAESIQLCRALIGKKSWKEISQILAGLKEQDPEPIRRHVLGYCQAILIKGATNDQVAIVMGEFLEPFYNTGTPGLIYACYNVVRGG